MLEFITGFVTVWRIVCLVAGGVSAALTFALGAIVVALFLGGIFDVCTRAMAKRWAKTGYQPKNRMCRIILENHKRLGS